MICECCFENFDPSRVPTRVPADIRKCDPCFVWCSRKRQRCQERVSDEVFEEYRANLLMKMRSAQ